MTVRFQRILDTGSFRGAGTWGPPICLFAPPGITLITIASANL